MYLWTIILALQLKNPNVNVQILLTLLYDPHLLFLWMSLTHVFVSFQQTPVFWEEEEVSDHLFFLFNYIPSMFFFFSCVIKAIKVALIRSRILAHILLWHSHGRWQTLVSISLQVSVWNVAECKTNTLEHSAAHCATLRDGHYFSGLPKNIIIKAMEEIWGSRAWCGNNGLGTPVECYCPIPLFFFSQIWLLLWHDWNNHSSSQ